MLFTNLQLALEAIVDSYNDIIALLGMFFSRIIEEFYPWTVHHIVPQLTRTQRYYIPLSGPTGYIAWASTNLARIEALKVFMPTKKPTYLNEPTTNKTQETNVLDQFYRARRALDPISSKPLQDLNFCFTPSEKISKEISALLE